MRLLIDTRILLWRLQDSHELSRYARQLLQASALAKYGPALIV
jgi:PIN domain nuclease of toxin-antitoxin system